MSLNIGRIIGIPVRIHYTLWLVLLLIAWSLAEGYMPTALSRPWCDHLLGNRNSLRYRPFRLGLPPRTFPLVHRQEKRSADQEDHTLLLRRSLRNGRGAEGSSAGSSHGRSRPAHKLSDRNRPRRVLVSYGLSRRTKAGRTN